MNDICFWSIADGHYCDLLQMLVNSYLQVGMQHDFHAFSEFPIAGATTHLIEPFDKKLYLFKFKFLQEVKKLNYKYYIYLDADTIFVRKPDDLTKLLQGSPVHMFLEHDCSEIAFRAKWAGFPSVPAFAQMMKDCGITSKIYNVNSGFFILKHEIIDQFCELALEFWKIAEKNGLSIYEEPCMAYAMHRLCPNVENHLHEKFFHIWATDWFGQFLDRYPDKINWYFQTYMTLRKHKINPAIIHVPQSKNLLMGMGAFLRKKNKG